MGIKNYRPTTNGRRHGSILDYSELTERGNRHKIKPIKSLCEPLNRAWGRNNQGKVTSRHRGGGVKRMYRRIDFKRLKDNVPAKVVRIEYDPNRTANIALIEYEDGELSYILAPKGLEVGATVMNGPNAEPKVGNCLPMKNIPDGIEIHNIELNRGQGAKLVRSAGVVARLSAKEGKYAIVKLPSDELRKIFVECRATIGQVGNTDHQNVVIGKAGRKRHMGIRPRNRGTALNPVQHPMGGGNKRAGGGRHPCSRTGTLAKGGNTRKKAKPGSKLIIRGRKRGPHATGKK